MKMMLTELDLLSALYVMRNLRPADVRELEATRYGDLDRDALAYEITKVWTLNGHGWAAYGDGQPVALFGAAQPWPGVFSAFMLATDDFPRIALPVTKFVRRIFIPFLRQHGHRVEARSIEGHDEAHRWLRVLGATEECRMKAFAKDGADFLVFTLALDPAAQYEDNEDGRGFHVQA
jgi:hypothetical protein